MKTNRENQFKLGGKALAAGVYSWTDISTEITEELRYYDGTDRQEVMKCVAAFSFSADSIDVTDEAYLLVRGMYGKSGDDRVTTFEWTDIVSVTRKWNCTVTNIKVAGGEANGKDGLSFEVHCYEEIA